MARRIHIQRFGHRDLDFHGEDRDSPQGERACYIRRISRDGVEAEPLEPEPDEVAGWEQGPLIAIDAQGRIFQLARKKKAPEMILWEP